MLIRPNIKFFWRCFLKVWMQLSQDYNAQLHDLFMAKLEAYDFPTDALNLVCDYLSDRKQKVKINETYTKVNNKINEIHDNSGFYTSTFLQLVNGSKNSILYWVFKLNLFKSLKVYFVIVVFFFFFLYVCLEKP